MQGSAQQAEISGSEAERRQSAVRLYVIVVVCPYILIAYLLGYLSENDARMLGLYLIVFIPLAIQIFVWVRIRPEFSLMRRFVSITIDWVGVTWNMSFGEETTVPFFALLLWITLGTGLRFGSRYLALGVCLSLVSLGVVWLFNPFWNSNALMVVTFALTLFVIPVYVLILLRRVEAAYAAAREANVVKSRFLAQASHDLRQPIHAISLFTACLRVSGLQTKELELVDNIDRSLASVSRLFKSLLDISTLDSGKVTPVSEIVAINEVLEDVARQNADLLQRDGTSVVIVPCSLSVSVDRGLFTTMLQNVVNNAAKYAPGQAILIGCRRRRGRLSVEVIDNGPGISQADQARVFDEFYQVRKRGDRDIEGVGLGLSIVSRVAAVLELTIGLQSVPGKGTRVHIDGLVIVDQTRFPEKRLQASPAVPVGGLRVLLVEDDQAVLLATASLLRRWGCIVQAAPTIPALVDECDLLITDYDLGDGMTGTECIANVRRLVGWDLPAVVMTGHDASRVREDLKDSSVPVLSKPLQPAELRSVILGMTMKAQSFTGSADLQRFLSPLQPPVH